MNEEQKQKIRGRIDEVIDSLDDAMQYAEKAKLFCEDCSGELLSALTFTDDASAILRRD